MKLLFKLILAEIGKRNLAMNIFLSMLSGFASFFFINLLNRLMEKIITGRFSELTWIYALQLLVIVLTFIISKRILSVRIVNLSQNIFWKLRKRIIALVLRTSYDRMVDKRNEINIALNSDVNALSTASYGVIDFFTSIIIGISIMAYLASVSLVLFAATILTAFLGAFFYSRSQKKVHGRFAEAISLENRYMQKTNALLDGFKEVYMDTRKGKEICERDLETASHNASKVNLEAQTSMMNGQAMVQLLFYGLIGSVLLFSAKITSLPADAIIKFLFSLLFLVGSISTVVTQLPVLTRANASYRHISSISAELESMQVVNETDTPVPAFSSLTAENISFVYPGSADGFSIGPFSFTIRKGEMVFIYGGNGSGKTTFINILMGVYPHSSGELLLNECKLTESDYPAYRRNFAFVASDYYLFEELYGVEEVDMESWGQYLDLFELTGHVTLTGRKFSTTKLSTGQRKRLALIAALMEKKPVLVLDEWAADQDPHFRKKFYNEVLPAIQNKGITIIAVTHDDRYYHCADRLFHMEEGLLIRDNIKQFQK